jgi:hypothetical protein
MAKNIPTTHVSEHFTKKEFACPTTGRIRVQDNFFTHLERLRVAYDSPMITTSGCRTQEHNEWLIRRGYAASPNSFHLIANPKYFTDTCALDIARPNGEDFHRLVRIATEQQWAIGIASSFIHLDCRAFYADLPAIIYTYD